MTLPNLDTTGLAIFNKLVSHNSSTREHARSVLQDYDGAAEERKKELFTQWVNAQRARDFKRDATETELDFVMPAAQTLLAIASNPLVTLPTVYGAFVLTHTVTEALTEDGAPRCEPIVTTDPEAASKFVLYVRSRCYIGLDGVQLLRAELIAYGSSYPARLPWVKSFLNEIAQPQYARSSIQINLSYAGQTSEPGKQAVERLLDDLQGDAAVHFQNYCRVAAETRRSLNVPPATWKFYEFVESPPCDPIQLRTRLDLQAAETAAIGALLSFALNSAFGGFHHLDFHPQYHPTDPSLLLTTPSLPLPDAQRQLILRHCEDVRQVCETIPDAGPSISDPAFAAVKRQATDLRAVGNGFTLAVTVARDITHEALRARDAESSFYGPEVGPGPGWYLFARRCCMAAFFVLRQSIQWVALVGGFWDFWTVIVVHVHVWLSLLFLVRYIRIARPLFIRVQSAKVCNLFVPGALAEVVLDNEQTRSTLALFWACRMTSFTLLRLCVQNCWIVRVWVELVPPNWVWWIGEVVVCGVGPVETDWALVCLMGHDGRLKYDPSLVVPLARLHTIAHRIAVITEEIVLQRTLAGPPDTAHLKAWLISCRLAVNNRLEADGLIAERNQARREVADLQAWLGSKRYKGAFRMDGARTQAESERRLEEFEADIRARRSATARQSHANDLHVVGEKNSPERLIQFQNVLATIADLEERGLADLVTPFPRPRGYNEVQWQIWWTTRDANCNLVQAKKAQDQGNAANASYNPEASMAAWEQSGLAAWLAANRPNHQEWRGKLTLAQGIARQILGAHTATNERDRILTCVQCGQVEITTLNGKHWCQEGGNGYTSSSDKGVYTVHVWDVQQLLQHPQVGLDAWKASKTTELEQAAEATAAEDTSAATTGSTIHERVEALWEAELATQGLRLMSRALLNVVVSRMATQWSWVDTSLVDQLPLPFIKTDAPSSLHSSYVHTQLGHSCIRANALHQPERALPSALDLNLDDTPLWEARRFAALLNSLSQNESIHETLCAASEPCAYLGASHVTGAQMQHVCIEKKRRMLQLGRKVAREFRELPVIWQHRVWCHVREQGGSIANSRWKAV